MSVSWDQVRERGSGKKKKKKKLNWKGPVEPRKLWEGRMDFGLGTPWCGGDVPVQDLRSLTFYAHVLQDEVTTFGLFNIKNAKDHITYEFKDNYNIFWSFKVLFHLHKK